MTRLQSLSDAPNTAREYEMIYVLRPNTTNEGVAEVNTRVKGVIESMGGKVIKVDNWGKRRLAYEVSKERKGIFLYWLYLASPGIVEEAERNLRMLDNVIRFLSVKVDSNIDVAARPSEIDEQSYEKAATTAADEEDMFLSRGGDEPKSDDDDDDDYSNYSEERAAAAALLAKEAAKDAAPVAPVAPAADATPETEEKE